MIALKFTRQSEADILSIHDYTIEMFGLKQWTVYESALRTALETIRTNPLAGSDCSNIRQHVRRLVFERHVIYYRSHPDVVLVLRVLGVRQDPGRHL